MNIKRLLITWFLLTVMVVSYGAAGDLTVIIGRPTDTTVTLSVLAAADSECFLEYGQEKNRYSRKSVCFKVNAGIPHEYTLTGLIPNCRYYYRVQRRGAGDADFHAEAESTWITRRAAGSEFVFGVQGDSHPERAGKMFSAALYGQTLKNVADDHPDFYFMLGDDFSIERLIERKEVTAAAVNQVYLRQRAWLGPVGRNTALFSVNGNHEQAAKYLLDGTAENPAVLAARARNMFFPLPEPNGFYSGDDEPVAGVGNLRDYFAWEWGDALFVVIDPYWHSAAAVDNQAGQRVQRKNEGTKKRDLWAITLGDRQYHWLERTLTESRARWKFVFCHHVQGTGRGGIEMAGLYEWGGHDRRGLDRFAEQRPGWALPIHQLMVKTGVTILFQGHDHLYARQELDGVVYQSCPNPADPAYQAHNRDAYKSGTIQPNSGHLRISVAAERVKVEYVRAFMPSDAAQGMINGTLADHYEIKAKKQ